VFCDVSRIPQNLVRHGALAFAGVPPQNAMISAEVGPSDTVIKLSEAVSPTLARLNPGYEIQARRANVALLKESPRMVIDARWKENARAAVMHMEESGARYVWLGFDPDALVEKDDRQLL